MATRSSGYAYGRTVYYCTTATSSSIYITTGGTHSTTQCYLPLTQAQGREYWASAKLRAERNWKTEQAKRQVDKEKMEAATRRARELILEHLTETQRETFEKNKWFIVEGGKTKRKFKIQTDGHFQHNVYELDANELPVTQLCFHLEGEDLPHDDHFLAQKLCLEYDEEATLKIANKIAA